MCEKRGLLYWEGSSKKDFKTFPIDVQKDMGVALFVVQLGGTPDTSKKRLKAVFARYGINRRT